MTFSVQKNSRIWVKYFMLDINNILYCKLGNFSIDFIFANFEDVEFRKNKTLAKWQKLFVLH